MAELEQNSLPMSSSSSTGDGVLSLSDVSSNRSRSSGEAEQFHELSDEFLADQSEDQSGDSAVLCKFDAAVIKEHCLCGQCQDFFIDKEQLLAIFRGNCPGCPVRCKREDDSTEPGGLEGGRGGMAVLLEGIQDRVQDGMDGAEQVPVANEEINDDFLVCYIGRYDGNRHYMEDARILPCFHHFCGKCLKDLAKQQLKEYRERKGMEENEEIGAPIPFCCPECPLVLYDANDKEPDIKINNDGEVTYNKAESESLQSFADKYASEKRLVNGEELCGYCCEDDCQIAVAECVDEGDEVIPLCKDCLRRHKSARATKHHRIILADELKSLPSNERFHHYKSPMCKKHGDCTICMYCPTHKMVVCTKCAREEEHEDCKGLFDVTARFGDDVELTHRRQFNELNGDFKVLSDNMATAIESLEMQVKRLTGERNKVIRVTNDRSNALKHEIEVKRREVTGQVTRLCQLKQEEFNGHIQRIRQIKHAVDFVLGWVRTYCDASNPLAFYQLKDKMADKMESYIGRYKLKFSEDTRLMNTSVFYKRSDLASMNEVFKPFCADFFGVVHSTPCLRKFTLSGDVQGSPISLVCRDIMGTNLFNRLPDIDARLIAANFNPIPPGIVSAHTECDPIRKDESRGVYELHLKNSPNILPGEYRLILSYPNPPAFFVYEEFGQVINLRYSQETNRFHLID